MQDIIDGWERQKNRDREAARRDPFTGRLKPVWRYEVRVGGQVFKHVCTLKRARALVRKLRAGNFEDNSYFTGPLGERVVSLHDLPH